MILWRIAAETRRIAADDLTGAGAAICPGRWNDDKEPVVYTAASAALAVLETAAHIDAAGLPLNRYLIRIDVPDLVWAARETFDAETLPRTWNAIPAGGASVRAGSRWLAGMRSPMLAVPSVIVPEDSVILINPHHPANAGLKAVVTRRFAYQRLFRGN